MPIAVRFHMSNVYLIVKTVCLSVLLFTMQLSGLIDDAKAADKEKPKLSSQVKQGKIFFMQSCKRCHQSNGIGKPGTAPSLTNKELLSIASDSFLKNTIKNGRDHTAMPRFSYLGDQKINAIIAYLRSFSNSKNRADMVAAQPKAKGSVASGKALFNSICAGCHGPDGNGYEAGGTGTAIGKAGFLNEVSDGFIRTTVKEGRSNTRMRGFQGPEGLANLSDQEIDDVITYLRTVPSK